MAIGYENTGDQPLNCILRYRKADMVLESSIWVVSLAATLLLQPALAQADDNTEQGARFTYPTESDLVFHEQDTVRVSWESEYSSGALWTFCREADDDGENVLRTSE